MEVHGPRPQVGDDVYVPTALHLGRGRDDFHGGLCRIAAVHELPAGLFVEVEENPGTLHAWRYLVENQDEWRERFGLARGYPDPDLRPEFNEP